MKLASAVRSTAAAALSAAPALAFASEAAVEGQGDLGGPMALLYLVGGVAALGVVIWVMVKFMSK